VSAPSDPGDALKWALNHSGDFWWVWGAIAAGIAWTSKRMRDWNRRNPADPAVLAARAKARAALMSALAPAVAARQGAAPASAAPAPPAPVSQAAPPARKMQRQPAPAQRAVTPIARSMDVPTTARATAGSWSLLGAFGDPAHARTAIVVAEVLGPPVGLRQQPGRLW
jgi:hypothetical protein